MEGAVSFRLAFHTAEKELPFGTCNLGDGEEYEFIFGDNSRVCQSAWLIY